MVFFVFQETYTFLGNTYLDAGRILTIYICIILDELVPKRNVSIPPSSSFYTLVLESWNTKIDRVVLHPSNPNALVPIIKKQARGREATEVVFA